MTQLRAAPGQANAPMPAPNPTEAVLAVDNLWVEYGSQARALQTGSTPALAGISLFVDRGEIVGVVGESGSGKSSLALAVSGLVAAKRGSIVVGGRDLRAEKGNVAVQLVFQDPHGSLDPRQRIGAGLTEIRRVHGVRTSWISDAALLERVGLGGEMLGRFPHQLSGGQCQRIALARALLLRPSLLLADEPTSSLDVSVQAQILQLLYGLSRDEGLAVLLISHDLAVVRQICARIYVMKRGLFVESGPTSDVFSSPRHDYTKRLIGSIPGRSFSGRLGSRTQEEGRHVD